MLPIRFRGDFTSGCDVDWKKVYVGMVNEGLLGILRMVVGILNEF